MRGSYFWQLVVLTGLAMVGQPAVWGNQKPDRPGKTTIGFQLYRDYLIVVQGSVGPLKDLHFLLDTGSNPTILDPQLVRRLHLDVTPAAVAVLSGDVKGGITTAPSLELGPIRRDNVPVVIEDLSHAQDAFPFRIDGIVGLDILGQSTFVIDYSSREIRFGPAPSMPDSIQLQVKDGLAFVDAVFNHNRVRLLVDTGASSVVIFKELPDPMSGEKGDVAQPLPKRAREINRKQVRQISLRLGEVEFGHGLVSVVPNHRDAGHDFDGLMSPVALGITRIAIDLTQRTLEFSRE
jgi:predicted aspartyl protease